MNIERLFGRRERVVAGAISGTSVDGVDAVIARLSGSGPGMSISVLGHAHADYEAEVRDLLLANSAPSGGSPEAISQLNAVLPLFFSEAIKGALEDADLSLAELDLVGSHGQTIHHVPEPKAVGSNLVISTLQIADPSVLATVLAVPVVGDFRTADMALGGQGAPLVPYFDYVRFRDESESRVLLNLGGIANITILPAGCASSDIVAFDTGPANMVIDALADRFFRMTFDRGGEIAGGGTPDSNLLQHLMSDEYYSRKPPKSTGREQYGAAFVTELCARFADGRGPEPDWKERDKADLMATATALSARTVAEGIAASTGTGIIARVIAAGGGTRNETLMAMLRDALHPTIVEPIEVYGIGSTEKEALCFAVLAHELMNGIPTGLPSVTGASRPAMQGKICLPS